MNGATALLVAASAVQGRDLWRTGQQRRIPQMEALGLLMMVAGVAVLMEMMSDG